MYKIDIFFNHSLNYEYFPFAVLAVSGFAIFELRVLSVCSTCGFRLCNFWIISTFRLQYLLISVLTVSSTCRWQYLQFQATRIIIGIERQLNENVRIQIDLTLNFYFLYLFTKLFTKKLMLYLSVIMWEWSISVKEN